MNSFVYKIEDRNIIPKILEHIPLAPNSWMRDYDPVSIDSWREIFDHYSQFGDNFKIATAYQNDKLISFSTVLFPTTIPQWFYLQNFSVVKINSLSKYYIDLHTRLIDTLVRYAESLGYYSFLGAVGVKHDSIINKIWNSPKRDNNYFRYNKHFEWHYKENETPKFKTHATFTRLGYFKFESVISNYVLRPEFRPQKI